MKVDIENGQYSLEFTGEGRLIATRYGEKIQDYSGSKFMYCLLSELYEERKLRKKYEVALLKIRDCVIEPHYISEFTETILSNWRTSQ